MSQIYCFKDIVKDEDGNQVLNVPCDVCGKGTYVPVHSPDIEIIFRLMLSRPINSICKRCEKKMTEEERLLWEQKKEKNSPIIDVTLKSEVTHPKKKKQSSEKE